MPTGLPFSSNVNGGIEGEIAACKTFEFLLSDFEQPTENKVSKMQALSNSLLVYVCEILIILFFTVGTTFTILEALSKID